MNIAVDAMRGGFAPQAPVEGTLQIKPNCPAKLLLIGKKSRSNCIVRATKKTSKREVIHAPEAVGMGGFCLEVIRKSKSSSPSVGMKLLAEGEVDALISAGNSGAIVATAKHVVGPIPGLKRPAFPISIPTANGKILLVDAGAHSRVSNLHLVQYATLTDSYLKISEDLPRPTLALLNIGSEPSRGPAPLRAAYSLLKHLPLHFVGNTEPQEVFSRRVDAVVRDGFVGNLLIKILERIIETCIKYLEKKTKGRGGSCSSGSDLSNVAKITSGVAPYC